MLHHHKLQSKCHNVSFKQEVVCNKHMAVLATGCCSEHADARGAHIAMPANHLCAVFICCYACMQPSGRAWSTGLSTNVTTVTGRTVFLL